MKSLLAELNMRYFNSANGFIIYKLYFIVKVVILLNIKAIFYFC